MIFKRAVHKFQPKQCSIAIQYTPGRGAKGMPGAIRKASEIRAGSSIAFQEAHLFRSCANYWAYSSAASYTYLMLIGDPDLPFSTCQVS
jgi:hypothetical protein